MISVIVIGAGLAALLAGNELSRKGFDVQILEAGDTLVRPRTEIKLPYQLIWEAPLVQSNGKLVPITSAARLRSTISMIINLSERRLQAANGTLADFIKDEFESALQASTKDLDPELAFEYLRHFEKIQCTRFCFDTFFDASKKVFPQMKLGRSQRSYNHNNEVKVNPTVQLKKKVLNINTNSDKVIVQTEDGVKLESDHVIIGLPLGVLKESYITLFDPPLPQEKINAIESLGVGVVTIINIEFENSLIKDGWTGVNFLWTNRDYQQVRSTNYNWILGIIGFYPFGNQTDKLWAVNQGKAAIDMELASKKDLTDGLKFLLARFVNQPEKNQFDTMKITVNKPFASHRGSFAYESVTAELYRASRDDFKQPVLNDQRKPVIWFTGELIESEEATTGMITATSILSYYKTKNVHNKSRRPARNTKLIKDVDVLVLGAGVSGISAALTLANESNKTFLVLEADYKIGGRVQNEPLVNSDPELKKEYAVVPSGAQWLLRTDNLLYEYAKEKKFIIKDITNSDMGVFYLEDGEEIDRDLVDSVMEDVGQILEKVQIFYKHKSKSFPPNLGTFLTNEFEKKVYRKSNQLRRQIFDWHKRYYTIDSGTDNLEKVSAKEWGRFESPMQHILLRSGLAELLKSMADQVGQEFILRHKFVQKIHWAANLSLKNNRTRKIVVQCKDGSLYAADHVIITFSLGVLKHDFGTLFHPKLPPKHKQAIQCLGFGSMDKIFLQFDSKWWEGSGIHFIYKNFTYEDAPWTRWILGFKTFEGLQNTLVGWVGGYGIDKMESMTDYEILEDVLQLMVQFVGKVPYPKRYLVSRWRSNTLTRGTFSYASADCDANGLSPNDLSPLTTDNREFSYYSNVEGKLKGNSEKNLVVFAGEACSERYFSTVHGAFQSGAERARKVIRN